MSEKTIKSEKADKKKDNFLDFIPVHSEKNRVETGEDGSVTIFVENKGVFNWLAQKLFFKPRFTQVHLEEFGNFIWPLIDGRKNVKQIADSVHEKFGEKADPLYPRISMYMKMLDRYGFIEYVK